MLRFRCGVCILSLIFFLLLACGDKENIVVFNRSEVIRLLSSDTSKSWTRLDVTIDGIPNNYTECEMFTNTQYISRKDSLIYIISAQPEYCDGNSEIIESGLWDLFEESNISDRIDRIAYYSFEGDTIVKEMLEITSLYLSTKDDNTGVSIVETFESKLTD